ncbi:RNA polymerase I-specific transcription initiation factor RRN3 [Microtus ochrogaster]|uniref:RNA polymerase I-specific transcription initiation factor RRN3 n=1 Tax=Microtus ochrogaster TaxID=79684 RepID=A0A8J6KQP6_MICOH|nr:RNA polymerase I-specific transcription initiation factor RRN3 [Microtus ochrogaster]
MLALESDFFNSPPRKTVRFGGTVTEVLLKYKKGETNDLELLKNQLSDPDIKDDQIINWLLEFRSSVMYLTKDFEQLINIILRLPWLKRSQTVVEEYLAFLGNLVSAQTVFLRPCLSMIASHFVPPRVIIKEGGIDVSDSEDEDDMLWRRPVVILGDPDTWEAKQEDLGKFEFPQTLKTPSDFCNVSFHFLKDEDEDTEPEKKADLDRPSQMAHPIAERLDILLSLLLSYIEDVCRVDGKIDNSKTKDLYRDLIAIFDKLLLPTHASCHVQFFMFFLCSFKLGFAEAFLEHLWKKLQDPNNPAITRQAAANYIGSFLARAKFIPLITVKSCLDLLVNWLHMYLNNQDSGTKAFCDVALHGPFYSACQAVFYTFVFRYKQLLSGNLKEGLRYLQSLNLERVVLSQLNPLKICLPSVVNFFAAITNKYQLVFCYTIMERNNRQMLPVIRSTAGGDSVQTCTNPLDTFFPFDPCMLKRSKKFIDPIYQIWEDVSAEELQEFKKPTEKELVEDEDDDFLKGEVPQSDAVIGLTPSSFDSHFRSPSSSLGSPPVLYMPDQSPLISRICD